jgi:hypothetical protein
VALARAMARAAADAPLWARLSEGAAAAASDHEGFASRHLALYAGLGLRAAA